MRLRAGIAAGGLALCLSSGYALREQARQQVQSHDERRAQQQLLADARVAKLEARADAFVSISKVWDPALVSEIVDQAHEVESFRDTMFWLHHEVGACVRYELVSVTARRMVRFDFLCQRGHVELGLRFDERGRVSGTLLGIRGEGIRAQVPVRKAQADILGWLAWNQAQPAALRDQLAAKLTKQFSPGAGCYLGADLLVGKEGARTLISCRDRDDQILTIDLDAEGQVRRASIVDASLAG